VVPHDVEASVIPGSTVEPGLGPQVCRKFFPGARQLGTGPLPRKEVFQFLGAQPLVRSIRAEIAVSCSLSQSIQDLTATIPAGSEILDQEADLLFYRCV
jgi:hypothetical protein